MHGESSDNIHYPIYSKIFEVKTRKIELTKLYVTCKCRSVKTGLNFARVQRQEICVFGSCLTQIIKCPIIGNSLIWSFFPAWTHF